MNCSWILILQHRTQELEERYEELQKNFDKVEKQLKYTKMKENKLMYLFYCAHESGLPINELYENRISKIPTERFEILWESDRSRRTNFQDPPQDDMYTKLRSGEFNKMLTSDLFASYSNISSYEPLAKGRPLMVDKPDYISPLNLDILEMNRWATDSQISLSMDKIPSIKPEAGIGTKSKSKFDNSRQNKLETTNKFLSSMQTFLKECEIEDDSKSLGWIVNSKQELEYEINIDWDLYSCSSIDDCRLS